MEQDPFKKEEGNDGNFDQRKSNASIIESIKEDLRPEILENIEDYKFIRLLTSEPSSFYENFSGIFPEQLKELSKHYDDTENQTIIDETNYYDAKDKLVVSKSYNWGSNGEKEEELGLAGHIKNIASYLSNTFPDLKDNINTENQTEAVKKITDLM